MRFIDFFSGIGGFRLGMEQAGHECVGHCEIDKWADKSYRAMHEVKGDEWFADDIARVRPDDLPEAEVYCGGFPCQAFSIAGKRGGFADTRGTLFFEIMRLAAVRKPKYLFLENVRGLLSHDGGRTFGTILATMGELGFSCQWQILNTKDFGPPQNRERIFIVGYSGKGSPGQIFPITKTSRQTLNELIGGSQGYRVYGTDGISCTLASEAGGMGAKTGLYLMNKNKGRIPIREDFNCIDANYHKGLDCHQARTGVLVKPVITPDRAEKRQNGRRFKDDGEPMFTLTARDRHGIMIKTGVPFVDKKYKEFVDENGYVPEMFNPYNCAEITDNAPTITSQAGSATSSSSVLIKDGSQKTMARDKSGVAIIRERRCEDGDVKEGNSTKVLRELRGEIGKEAFEKWGLGVVDTLQQAEILRQNLHEETLVKDGKAPRGETDPIKCKDNGKTSNENFPSTEKMSRVWESWQTGYSPHRQQRTKQLKRKLDDIMQKLSHEDTYHKELLQDMWEASEGLRLLRQALSEIQETWESPPCETGGDVGGETIGEEVVHNGSEIRIRRLTPL